MLSRFLSRVKGTLLLLVALFATTGMHAQTTYVEKTFKACALNVDGLPSTFNSDGPGAAGTTQIGNYIVGSNIDIVGISEDFNYHSQLSAAVSGTYNMGSWRGGIDISITSLVNPHFNTDGLMFLMKKSAGSFSNESYVKWNESLGDLTHGANENIEKGFRFYTVNLDVNVKIDVYILHMNTAEDADQIAVQDRQLTQLANAILANGDGRPKLIIGDTNCRYTRNKVAENLIKPLSKSYDIKDCWVEECLGGTAPEYGTANLEISDKTNASEYQTKEIVDKIIYLVPKGCTLQLECTGLEFEVDGYKKTDGTLLGDHVPVIATFKISGTPIEDDYTPGAQEDFWVGENLETIKDSEAYLFNVGEKTLITTEDQASEKDIQGAKVVKWKFTPSGSDYTITSGDYFLQMNATEQYILFVPYYIEDTGVRTGNGMPLTVSKSEATSGAYKFSKYGKFSSGAKSIRYFNVDGANYTNAESKSTKNDWLLISDDQKKAYFKYVDAYNEANDVRKNINDYSGVMTDEPELYDELLQTLLETKNTNYNNVDESIKELNDIVDEIKNRKGYVVTITEGNKSGESYYATLCLPWNAWVPEGVATYTGSFKQDSGDTRYITLNEYNNADKHTNGKTVIPAGIGGYILKTTKTGTFTFFRTGKPADAPAATNYLKGNPSMENVMPTDTEKGNVYVLAKKDRGLGFYNLAANNAIKHNCAYIVIEPEKVTQIKRVSFLFDDMPTAIDKAEAAINANATTVYGVAGEQRSALRRGINIVRMSDGTVRKVAVK
ncbi:MAG: hypothetical protein PUD32_01090 [Bacteroidales bacterium]|nr:hypothetical protein [Bacteroidales bacterium]